MAKIWWAERELDEDEINSRHFLPLVRFFIPDNFLPIWDRGSGNAIAICVPATFPVISQSSAGAKNTVTCHQANYRASAQSLVE